ncbi:MAG: hypothetical protein Q9187_005215, partial [Circinaria calcarea]
ESPQKRRGQTHQYDPASQPEDRSLVWALDDLDAPPMSLPANMQSARVRVLMDAMVKIDS